jgi:hypothetical protein
MVENKSHQCRFPRSDFSIDPIYPLASTKPLQEVGLRLITLLKIVERPFKGFLVSLGNLLISICDCRIPY